MTLDDKFDSEIGVRVRTIIADTTRTDYVDIKEADSLLREDLGLDEIDMAEIAIALEEEYKLEQIPESEMDGMLTTRSLVDYVITHYKP